jgi:dTDP-L-rhamnose 4-epimerase
VSTNEKRALVTGGAGLIGSHLADLLLREGWKVRVLDNLEPNTHRRGKPAWINPAAEFIEGDVRDRETMATALDQIDTVFHQAAYGGYMPEIAKYVHVNSFGTAQILEVIREKDLPIRKIIVASSQAVYSEGGRMSGARIGISQCSPGRTIAARRLGRSLPDLRCSHKKCADAGKCSDRRRDGLWPD